MDGEDRLCESETEVLAVAAQGLVGARQRLTQLGAPRQNARSIAERLRRCIPGLGEERAILGDLELLRELRTQRGLSALERFQLSTDRAFAIAEAVAAEQLAVG